MKKLSSVWTLYSLFFLTIFSFSNLGCKKTGGKKSDADLRSQIIGKWSFLRNVNYSFVNGRSESETENDNPGNYFEFRDDGTLTAVLDDGQDDGTWQLVNGKMRFNFDDGSFNGVDFSIITITKTEFTLYAKAVSGADYYETTMYMTQSGNQDPGPSDDVKANQKVVVDGKVTYTGKQVLFGVNYDPTTKLFVIGGGGPNSGFPGIGFNFFCTTSLRVGDIILLKQAQKHVDKYGWGRYMEALGAENDYWTEDSDYSGSITITQFNSKTRILSFTFKFKGVARDQYGKYLGEKTLSGGVETVYVVDATGGYWK